LLNTFYICTKEVWMTHTEAFHPQLGSHYLPLPDGRILVSCHFPQDHSSIESWEKKDGVEALPHPVFEGTKKLDPKHVVALASLGITANHTVVDVAKSAAAQHPLMKLRAF
jgi:hypothetical protein